MELEVAPHLESFLPFGFEGSAVNKPKTVPTSSWVVLRRNGLVEPRLSNIQVADQQLDN